MLSYDMPLYRPPSEAESLIVQATLGCSFNRCGFCSMYRSKQFQVRSLAEVYSDLELAARSLTGVRKLFLADGDAMVLPTDHLLSILRKARELFPELMRASAYAWPLNILKKKPDELQTLRDAGLRLIYVGVESGDPEILRRIRKGANPAMISETIQLAQAARIKVSATVILGLGGVALWQQHVDGTAKLINESPPNFLSTLQLGLADVVEDEFHRRFDDAFEWQDDEGMLIEQRELLKSIHPQRPVIFRSNHASNALALAGNLPRDSKRLVEQVEAAIRGDTGLRPHWIRGY